MSARAEALSDGVFAIAMTLLVLEIKVPPGDADLGLALAHQWVALAAFAVSFLYLGVYWLNHFIASRVTEVDGPLLVLNLVFLMTISFVPFPTEVLADRLAGGADLPRATAFYGVAMLLPALVGSANWTYALRARRFRGDLIGTERAVALARLYWIGPLLYAVAVAVSLAAPLVAIAFYALAPFLYLVSAAASPELRAFTAGPSR